MLPRLETELFACVILSLDIFLSNCDYQEENSVQAHRKGKTEYEIATCLVSSLLCYDGFEIDQDPFVALLHFLLPIISSSLHCEQSNTAEMP